MQSLVHTTGLGLKIEAQRSPSSRLWLSGIISTSMGTFLAVNLIPEDPTPKGALFLSALAMTAALTAVPLAAAFRDPKSFVRAEHVLVLAPIYWLLLDLLQGAYPLDEIQPEQPSTAFIAIGLFVMAAWIGVSYRPWQIPKFLSRSASINLPANFFFLLVFAAFGLGMLTFAIPSDFDIAKMFYSVGAERWEAPWTRGQFGAWNAFADQLQNFGYLLPVLTVIVAYHFGWRNIRTFICIGLTITMTIFLAQTGNRRVIGGICGMAIIAWMLIQQRLRMKYLLVGGIVCAALLLILQIMLEYRNVGLAALMEAPENGLTLTRDYVHVDDNFYRICQMFQLVPQYYPHTYYEYFVYVLVRPIPRVLWPGKPLDGGFDLAMVLGFKSVSFAITAIGELFVAAGFIAVVLGGWFYGRLAGFTNQLLTRPATLSAIIMYSIMTMSLFVGVRSMLELILVNYATLAWIGLSRGIAYWKGYNAS
jgi:oligosaccharide repeat unit polymerase